MNRIYIIAEAGVNHNGKLELARRLVDIAAEAGADAVKFQTFVTEKLVSRSAPKASYQKVTTDAGESQFDMIKELELDKVAYSELKNYSNQKGIDFLSSPFDIESIEFLNTLGLNILKIPSGEITNLPYLRKIGSLKKKIIISTGMADLGEIEDALDILIDSGTLRENIIVLHCTTEYPAPIEEINLRAMMTIRDALKVNVGFSDHSPGIEIPLAAAALGASVIEKHFTFDKNMAGPDHRASLDPGELRTMVSSIRNIEKAMGTGIKKPSPSEKKNIAVVRKSIVASRKIEAGESFTEGNITVKRPCNGISPMKWDMVVERKATRRFFEDEVVEI
ncbi:MAG: N-acetylneuraminate synthase [Vulcanimicrobiota bacterium]